MPCYYQGCSEQESTMEHVPPKSFFPKDQRNQLLTVPSCERHNNAKSPDDLYVLAHICLNSSPANRSREVFQKTILPQLGFNRDALKKTLTEGSLVHPSGTVAYQVDTARLDHFFTALSCGIVYKACKASLPGDYSINHLYHNLRSRASAEMKVLEDMVGSFYASDPIDVLDFGQVKALNASVYKVKIFGIADFGSSITIVHEFFGRFRVTSMLTKQHRFPTSLFRD